MEPAVSPLFARLEARFVRFLEQPNLGRRLALLAVVLASPCLLLGIHLDDYFAQYLYGNYPDSARLYDIYAGGYGLANGNPLDTHWLIDRGYAPWWTDPHLLVSMLRPLSLVTHLADARFWNDSPFLKHAHSLVWLALLVGAATRLYRGVLGPLVGGLAALLLAVDHTHGFIVGFIANRHALITTTLGILCLDLHHRSSLPGAKRALAGRAGAAALYLATLLAGEFGIAIAGYLAAHAVFLEKGNVRKRAASFAPYLVVTVLWRVVYTLLGHGSHGSGLYVDPTSSPVRFLGVLLERGPILNLGMFLVPPPELYVFAGPVGAKLLWTAGALFTVALAVGVVPLLRKSPEARFWAAGYVLSLVPAAAAFPSGRQLIMSSIAALALVAQFWELFTRELAGRPKPGLLRVLEPLAGLALFVHLCVSPFTSPIATCGVESSSGFARAADALGPEIAGKDVVLLNAPDYFAPRLAQIQKQLDGTVPRRWRALAGGPEPLTFRRTAANTLTLEWGGGLLDREYTALFRDRTLPMHVGDRVELDGLVVTVKDVTGDGRARVVEFAFDAPLDAPSFVFFSWSGGTYAPFPVPAVGTAVPLPQANIDLAATVRAFTNAVARLRR